MGGDCKVFVIPRLDPRRRTGGIQLCEHGRGMTERLRGTTEFMGGMTNDLLSFRRKPESSRTITFAEYTFRWIPRLNRGMTDDSGGMTGACGGMMDLLPGGG